MKRIVLRIGLITSVLLFLVLGGLNQKKAQAVSCDDPYSIAIYCEYEVNEGDVKTISWCLYYNFVTGEVYGCP